MDTKNISALRKVQNFTYFCYDIPKFTSFKPLKKHKKDVDRMFDRGEEVFKKQCGNLIKQYKNILEKNIEDILSSDFSFFEDRSYTIETKKACLPLSLIYIHCKNNENLSIQFEALIYNIFNEICAPEHKDDIMNICNEFVSDDAYDGLETRTFKNLMKKVQTKMSSSESNDSSTLIKDMMTDENIQQSVVDMIDKFASGSFSVDRLLKSVQNLKE
jgi:hypothetical protein